MSKKKKGFMSQYWTMVAKEKKPIYMDRHHPFGREGEYLLAYVIIPHFRHEEIHGTQRKQAMKEGWLQPPFEGRPYDPNWPRPWSAKEERLWPEHLKRLVN